MSRTKNSCSWRRRANAYQRRLERLELNNASLRTKTSLRSPSKDRTKETRLRDFLSWRNSPILNGVFICWKYLTTAGRSYVDFVTGAGTKLLRLLLSSTGWILLFTGFYWAILVSLPHHKSSTVDAVKCETVVERPSCWALFGHSALTFVQLQPGLPEVDEVLKISPSYRVLLFFQLCFAYLHLGLLISVLHRQLTRRAP